MFASVMPGGVHFPGLRRGRPGGGVRRAVLLAFASPQRRATTRRGVERVTPHRTFRDDVARLWNAWDVHPLWGERRLDDRRRRPGGPPPALNDRRRAERRMATGLRISLPPRLARGWIAFECGEERRRVAPIPDGWSSLDDDGLRALWRDAEHLPPRRRRLIE
jgi:hypothetical protein